MMFRPYKDFINPILITVTVDMVFNITLAYYLDRDNGSISLPRGKLAVPKFPRLACRVIPAYHSDIQLTHC